MNRNPTFKGDRRQRTLRIDARVDQALETFAREQQLTVNDCANMVFECLLLDGPRALVQKRSRRQ